MPSRSLNPLKLVLRIYIRIARKFSLRSYRKTKKMTQPGATTDLYPTSTPTPTPTSTTFGTPKMASPVIKSSLSPHPLARRDPSPVYPWNPSTLRRMSDRINLEIYRYELTFAMYTTPFLEKLSATSLMVSVFSLVMWIIWTICSYFMSLLLDQIGPLDWLPSGRNVTFDMLLCPR